MTIALYYSPGACSFAPHVVLREVGVAFELRKVSTADRSQGCLADIEAHLGRHAFAVGTNFSVVDPFWLVFYRWGARQKYEMKVLYPAYTSYIERLVQRPSIASALRAEAISPWE